MLHTAVHSSTPLAFKRYHGLLNGANQSPADGLLAWERVLRVHAQADETALPVFAKTDRGNSLDDDELTDLAAQFAELKQSIVKFAGSRRQFLQTTSSQHLPSTPLCPAGRHLLVLVHLLL